MKSIIINETNKDKIKAAIRGVEGKATARTIDYDDIVRATQHIEKKLGIPKKYMEGIRYDVDLHAQNFPKKYKYIPMSTHFVIEFSKRKWRLVSIERFYTRTAGNDYKCTTMPDETMKAIIETMRKFC